MIRHGVAPFLECSSHGDKRLSAFHARIRARGDRSIEEIYQGAKVFDVDGREVSGLSWRDAKGRKPKNVEAVRALYGQLWDEYIAENPDLVPVITTANGLSDKFGQAGHACQATELWRIRCRILGCDPRNEPSEPQMTLFDYRGGVASIWNPHRM
ncbi:hypothetical protein PUR29_35040 [Methylobacterium ajmalii]|uniref:Uncharacterized protein n=1 Tax=Methylobacterium ajmalii TaxID=2738439 RepID=A0ABV0A7F8_9HYPH